MKLTITTLMDEIYTFEVSDDMDLENFRALCELETGLPAGEVVVLWNGRPLQDNTRTLANYGIRDGDVLLLQRLQGMRGQPAQGRSRGNAGAPMIDFSQIQIPDLGQLQVPPTASSSASAPAAQASDFSEDPAVLREMLLASPHDLAMLKERNQPLSEALLSGSLERFTTVLNQQREERAARERERVRLLTADPFDAEAQRLIAEDIRLKNIEQNMETAIEHSPENFGQVTMLYINCHVNGHPVKAFVDSGAQMTIMSQACAERCNIMRLVDTRWAGIAKGVGTQKILGRVHLCQIQIDSIFLQTAFSILENQPMDMLLGLDMLKRHQAVIDLRQNVLIIGDVSTRFLDESELPEHARLNQLHEDERQLEDAIRQSQDEAATSRHGASTSGVRTTSARQPVFPDSDIQRLTSMGFSRQQVVDELTAHNGNVDAALASLLAKSLQVP